MPSMIAIPRNMRERMSFMFFAVFLFRVNDKKTRFSQDFRFNKSASSADFQATEKIFCTIKGAENEQGAALRTTFRCIHFRSPPV